MLLMMNIQKKFSSSILLSMPKPECVFPMNE
uniref:Uncharacterized protein n=1 Tax=Anguilla anguilla TaxID=7936 RepID=A0A0E9V5E4_ANGAN